MRRRRPRDGRWIAGVCLGLAEHFNISVTLVRIFTVLLGVPLLAYVVAWALIPSE
ncbi:PspC domain-containing protein [Microbacterium gorillae]|uniref:PspC domain-containing protein n=1 Tax=Microbacterium gorillae TaxID=1231063 RepID=UPI003D96B9B6